MVSGDAAASEGVDVATESTEYLMTFHFARAT